jgi:hypothetical protein
MRTLHADFARPAQWPVMALWTAAALLAALTAWEGVHDLREAKALSAKRAETAELGARLDSAHARQAGHAASAAEPPPFANDATHWLRLSRVDVGGVFRSVESAQVAGARLVSIEIDGEGRRAELEVEVTGADVASAYLDALNAGLARPAWALTRLQAQGGTETALIHEQLE